jgi:hypothetical protein
MRFTTTALLAALIALSAAVPQAVSSPNEARKAENALEGRGTVYCDCYPDCGCPSGSTCFCQGCVPPIRAPCYPDCGCDSSSAVCIVSFSPLF